MTTPAVATDRVPAPEKPGLLLIGHGTRDPEGTAEFERLATQVAPLLPGWAVQPCYLEFAQPDIAAGLAALVGQGVGRVAAMPLLLLAAGHAKRDIPELLTAAAAEYPDLHWRQTVHLGCHERLLELSAQRFRETLPQPPHGATNLPIGADETLLLFVGRGSTDPEANAEFAQFCRLRWERTPTAWYELCFTALAQPSLERGLEMAARLPLAQVVVQPHLLFAGRLLDRVRAAVAEQRERCPGKRWLIAEPLGAAAKLAQAVRQIVAGE